MHPPNPVNHRGEYHAIVRFPAHDPEEVIISENQFNENDETIFWHGLSRARAMEMAKTGEELTDGCQIILVGRYL